MTSAQHDTEVWPVPHVRCTRRSSGEKGFVIALMALLLIPLMAFTAFAVDLGAWHGRASQIQRAADAAALAGVPYLPDVAAATQYARSVAAKNGFVHGANGVTVTVHTSATLSTLSDDQLQVIIDDTEIPQYFSSVFTQDVEIERKATSELIQAVRMGSPRNYLGTGGLANVSGQLGAGTKPDGAENFWLAASGGCASKENGDRILARTTANYANVTTVNRSVRTPAPGGYTYISNPFGNFQCTSGATTNPEYDATGYFYAVEVPPGYSGGLRIEIYGAGSCSSATATNSSPGDQSAPTLNFTVRSPGPGNPADLPVIRPTNPISGASCTGWQTLHTVASPVAGVYYVQVQTPSGAGNSNAFALRAGSTSPTFTPCTSTLSTAVTGVGHSATCPNVYGLRNMGVYAPLQGSNPSFFLAETTPQQNGKTMEIELFDPGEGARGLEIIDPIGNPVSFTWEVDCPSGDTPPTGGCGPGTTNNLDLWGNEQWCEDTTRCPEKGNPLPRYVSGLNPQPGTRRGSTSKYSDRVLTLTVQLPSNIGTAYSGNTWWRIRYTTDAAGSPTDRTTWSVRILGDPIRLVPDP